MMTSHQNERNMATSSQNSPRNGTVKSATDISANYDLVSLNKSNGVGRQENINENIYSRPVDLAQSNTKHIQSNSKLSYKDVMTSSCHCRLNNSSGSGYSMIFR